MVQREETIRNIFARPGQIKDATDRSRKRTALYVCICVHRYNIHGAESLPSLCVVFWQSLVSDEDTNQVLPETLDLAKGTRAEEVVSGSQDLRCSDGHGRLTQAKSGSIRTSETCILCVKEDLLS
jgi:hypothetical protein